MTMNKDDIILYRGLGGLPSKGRIRHFYDSGRIGLWRSSDGHYVIIEREDVINTIPKEEWKSK